MNAPGHVALPWPDRATEIRVVTGMSAADVKGMAPEVSQERPEWDLMEAVHAAGVSECAVRYHSL